MWMLLLTPEAKSKSTSQVESDKAAQKSCDLSVAGARPERGVGRVAAAAYDTRLPLH